MAVVLAALAQLACLSMRWALPVQHGTMSNREGGEGATATRRGGITRAEENGGEAAVITLLVGLRWH